jgi:hypothetical protein
VCVCVCVRAYVCACVHVCVCVCVFIVIFSENIQKHAVQNMKPMKHVLPSCSIGYKIIEVFYVLVC